MPDPLTNRLLDNLTEDETDVLSPFEIASVVEEILQTRLTLESGIQRLRDYAEDNRAQNDRAC